MVVPIDRELPQRTAYFYLKTVLTNAMYARLSTSVNGVVTVGVRDVGNNALDFCRNAIKCWASLSKNSIMPNPD